VSDDGPLIRTSPRRGVCARTTRCRTRLMTKATSKSYLSIDARVASLAIRASVSIAPHPLKSPPARSSRKGDSLPPAKRALFELFALQSSPAGGLSTIVGAVEKVAQNLGITKKAVHHHINMAVRAADATLERAPAANVAHLPLAKVSPSAGLPRCRTFKLAASGRQCSAKANRVLY
jgi:hypothetical protein